jgi:thiol:disulfide interchange protein
MLVIGLTAFLYRRNLVPHTGVNDTSTATDALANALARAREHHMPLMVEFGAAWCSDCLELSQQLNEGKMRDFLTRQFVVVSIDVGEFNRNLNVARSLGVDVDQGIPAAIFFSANGGGPCPKRGTNQIVQYLKELAAHDARTVPMIHCS